MRLSDIQKTVITPVTRIENCSTSVQMTAFMPPKVVYKRGDRPHHQNASRQRDSREQRQHHRRRINHDRYVAAARQQKQSASQKASLQVKPSFQVFVPGVKLKAGVERKEKIHHDRDHQQKDHGLQEQFQVVAKTPGGNAHIADRAHVRGHQGNGNGNKTDGAAAEEIIRGGRLLSIEQTAHDGDG